MTDMNGNQPERSPADVNGKHEPHQAEVNENMNTQAEKDGQSGNLHAPLPEKPRYDVKFVEEYALKYAGFWTRSWAYLIDLVVLWSISRLLVFPIFRLAGWELSTNLWYAPITIITVVIFYTYFVLMTKFFGQTVGKMILGIRVVPIRGESLTWSSVIFREWVGRFISTALPILYFLYGIIAFTPKKQGIHDFIADTTVVHEGTYMKNVKKIFRKRESLSELQEPNAF